MKGELLALADPRVRAAVTKAEQDGKKPNIVMLMTDDTGWGDFGYMPGGGKALGHPTPNIDRIAKEGAVFTNWYGHNPYVPTPTFNSNVSLDFWVKAFFARTSNPIFSGPPTCRTGALSGRSLHNIFKEGLILQLHFPLAAEGDVSCNC